MATYTTGPGGAPPAPPYGQRPAWTAGRIVSVVIGSVLALAAIGLLVTGGVLLWADQTQRSGDYLTTPIRPLGTSGYAVTSDVVTLEPGSAGWVNNTFLGRIRVQATPVSGGRSVFIGIAPAGSVQTYLSGARYATVTGFAGTSGVTYLQHEGNVSPASPLSQRIWSAQASGTGTQTLTWQVRSGSWMIVIMNAGAAPGVSVTASAGATVPGLTGIAAGFLAAGVLAAAGAVALILIPVRLAGRTRAPWQPPGQLQGPPAPPPAP